jgi:hypothetical protein
MCLLLHIYFSWVSVCFSVLNGCTTLIVWYCVLQFEISIVFGRLIYMSVIVYGKIVLVLLVFDLYGSFQGCVHHVN